MKVKPKLLPKPQPTPEKFSSIACSISGPQQVQAFTVGDKRELQCKTAGTSVISQSQIQFVNGDQANPYTIVFLGEPQIKNDLIIQTITSYKVGANNLDHVFVKIDGKIYQSTPLQLDVRSVLPPAQTQAQPQAQGQGQEGQAQQGPTPYPIVDPQTVAVPLWWWILWGAVVLAVLGFVGRKIYLWRKARRARQTTEVAKELSLQEKYQARLRKLESQGYHSRGEYKRFALELTNIVKTAIGQEFGFPAEDQTTEEVLDTLAAKHKVFYKTAGNLLKNFFGDLDQIKFAKTETTLQGCEALLDQALRIGRALFGGSV